MLYLLRLMAAFGILVLAVPATGNDTLRHDVASALEKGRAAARTITLPTRKDMANGMKATEEAIRKYQAPERQAAVRREKERIAKELGKCTAVSSLVENPASSLGRNEKIYLFLSSSIPDETVRNYLLDIDRAGDSKLVPVMRGLVKGFSDMGASSRYFARILKEDPDCKDEPRNPCQRFRTNILVQPPLFAKYGIERVPALVYDNGGQVFLVRGDAALDYLLERINREAKQETLKHLVKAIRGNRDE